MYDHRAMRRLAIQKLMADPAEVCGALFADRNAGPYACVNEQIVTDPDLLFTALKKAYDVSRDPLFHQIGQIVIVAAVDLLLRQAETGQRGRAAIVHEGSGSAMVSPARKHEQFLVIALDQSAKARAHKFARLSYDAGRVRTAVHQIAQQNDGLAGWSALLMIGGDQCDKAIQLGRAAMHVPNGIDALTRRDGGKGLGRRTLLLATQK